MHPVYIFRLKRDCIIILYGFGFGGGVIGLYDYIFPIRNTLAWAGIVLMLFGGIAGILLHLERIKKQFSSEV